MENKYPNPYFKEKRCRTCDKYFTPLAPSQHYCTKECKGHNAYYKRNYGIDERTYKQMKETQNNQCAICGSEGFIIGRNGHTERLCVDHCHSSGRVRALLCHNCNRGLGIFQDNIDNLKEAIKYLEKHNDTH